MSRQKLNLPLQAEGIMKIVGARITSEIERIKTQKRLESSEKELKVSNASKDKFFSILAHDLRSPFNALMGFSELLYSKVEKNNFNDVKKYSQLIYTISNQSFSLLNNLLDWSLSQTNGLKYNPENIPLYELTTQMITYYNTIAENKKITIELKIKEDLSIFADKNMINTILRNFISNALKYTPQGGSIIISATKVTDGVHLSISDTGIGIEANALKKLFKIEESTSTKGLENEKGTGLGLIICKDLIEFHQGKIWAESELGKGSTFNLTLPVN